MKKGTLYFVIRFPYPWPLEKETKIFSKNYDKSLIEIFAIINGSIRIIISDNKGIIKEFNSQPIYFSNTGYVLMSMLWDEDRFDLYINSKKIVDFYCNDSILIEVNENLPKGQLSIYDKDAKKHCQEWVKWRTHRYLNLKDNSKADRRIKKISEQVDELKNAVKSLDSLLTEFNNGKTFLLPNIFPILRALLFWTDNNSSTYNPLLFRLAGFYKIALPLYAFPTMDNEKLVFNNPTQHIKFNEPLLQKKLTNQVLMDFQEWLTSDIYIEKLEDLFPNSAYKIERKMTFKDLIFEAANTMGTAHYDDDLPIKIDNLINTEVFGKNFLVDFTTKISVTTIFFSNYIFQIIDKINKEAKTD